jgi:mevalonate kinase
LNLSVDNQRLNEIVYQTEKIHHGTPSGIDNTVIVYEQPVYFRRSSPIEHLTIQHPFHLLIANTGEQSLTRIAVGDVRRLYDSKPQQIQGILDAIGQLVRQARQAMEQGNSIELGQLMSKNHTLLQQLTVSSTELDMLVEAALANGALGAKLSGGGRGGNVIALVTPDNSSTIENALYAVGASHVYTTVVGSF